MFRKEVEMPKYLPVFVCMFVGKKNESAEVM
jgi:hypothetical protein